jgi:hypothetical protein
MPARVTDPRTLLRLADLISDELDVHVADVEAYADPHVSDAFAVCARRSGGLCIAYAVVNTRTGIVEEVEFASWPPRSLLDAER